MQSLTVGEAKTRLARCRAEAEGLHAKLAALPAEAKVTGIVIRPVPIPFAQCCRVAEDHIMVADYAQGIQGIIQWLSELIETLDAPDGHPFAEGPRS